MRTSSYKSPYSHLDADELVHIQFFASKTDRDFLKCLDPDFGFVTYIGALAIKTLTNDFKNAGITHYDPENTGKIRTVLAARFGPLAQNTTSQVDSEAGGRNDKGGTRGVRKTSKDNKVHTTPDDSADRVGRRSRGGSKKESKGEGEV